MPGRSKVGVKFMDSERPEFWTELVAFYLDYNLLSAFGSA